MTETDDRKDAVDIVEDDLRKVETELERIGRKVCDMRGSSMTHGHINAAVREVQEAVHNAYLMRDYSDEA